jgi:hypothetical protein
MRRFFGTIALGVAISGLTLAARSQVATPASPLRSFDWTYIEPPEPGTRHWSSSDGIVWTETFPSGRTEVQRVGASAEVFGCDGVITTKSYSPTAQTFIPNPGCPAMRLLFRFGDQPWAVVGSMRAPSFTLDGDHAPPPTSAAPAAASPAPQPGARLDASDLPHLRPGRWKVVTAPLGGVLTLRAGDSGVSFVCVSGRRLPIGHLARCSDTFTRTDQATYVVYSSCTTKMGVLVSHTVISGDFQTHLTLDRTTLIPPLPAGGCCGARGPFTDTMHIDETWAGRCRRGDYRPPDDR